MKKKVRVIVCSLIVLGCVVGGLVVRLVERKRLLLYNE